MSTETRYTETLDKHVANHPHRTETDFGETIEVDGVEIKVGKEFLEDEGIDGVKDVILELANDLEEVL